MPQAVRGSHFWSISQASCATRWPPDISSSLNYSVIPWLKVKAPKQKSYGEHFREFGLFKLEKRRLRGDFLGLWNYVKGSVSKERISLFSQAISNRTRGNGFGLHPRRFRLGIRTIFFMERVIKYCNRLPEGGWVTISGDTKMYRCGTQGDGLVVDLKAWESFPTLTIVWFYDCICSALLHSIVQYSVAKTQWKCQLLH